MLERIPLTKLYLKVVKLGSYMKQEISKMKKLCSLILHSRKTYIYDDVAQIITLNMTRNFSYQAKARPICFTQYTNIDKVEKFYHSCLRTYNQRQKLQEKLLSEQFRVSTPFSLLTMLRTNEQNLRQAILWFRNIVQGERGDF